MKKLLSLLAVGIIGTVTATSASAEEYATITKVQPNYITVQTPRVRTECQIREVPIYGQSQSDAAGAITGAIIGGAIGNQIGKGSGKDVATGIGAILGAQIGGNRQGNVIGYRQKEECHNIRYHETGEELKDYTIWYEWEGVQGRSRTYNTYRVGDKIPVWVSINAK